MEIIELTAENIDRYIDDCLEAQSHLVKSHESVSRQNFIDTAGDTHGYLMGVVNEEGKLMGLGLVSKIVDPVRVIGYVNNIVVHPDARGKGLFAVIMDELEARAREWGCTQIELTCSRENVQVMYDKRGYEAKDTKYYKLKL